jgi:PAS domain S-box-containing protein
MDERTKNYKLISAEKNFHKNENLYRTIFNNTGTAMIIIENDKTVSLANQQFAKLSGYTREEIEGKKSWAEFVAKKDLNTMKEYHELRRTDPDSAPAYYEFQFINKHGKIKDIYLTVAMIPGTKQSVASLLDITDIKKTEKALRLSEEKYRLLAENISDIIWTMDMNLRFMYVSPSLETTTGYTPDEMMNLTLDKIMTRDSFKAALDVFEEEKAIEASGMQNQVRTQSIELEEICKDGSTIWIEAKMSAIRDMEGRWVGILGVTRDITARKLAEDKLKAYSEKLEYMVEERTKELSILKSVAEGLIVTDIYDKIILMNSAAENLLNIRFNEAYGRHIDNAIQDIKLRERFKSTLEKKKTGYCFDFELPGENKKDPRIIRARTSMMSNKAGKHTGIIIIMYDVTYERERIYLHSSP